MSHLLDSGIDICSQPNSRKAPAYAISQHWIRVFVAQKRTSMFIDVPSTMNNSYLSEAPTSESRVSPKRIGDSWLAVNRVYKTEGANVRRWIEASQHRHPLVGEVEQFASRLQQRALSDNIDVEGLLRAASSFFKNDYVRPFSGPLSEELFDTLTDDDATSTYSGR